MTPRDLNRRLTILRRLWPTHTPVLDMQRVLDRDGRHWSEGAVRKRAAELRLFRPQPTPLLGSSVPEPTEWEIRAASRAFGSQMTPAPAPRKAEMQQDAPRRPWQSIMIRVPDPRLVSARRIQGDSNA